MLRFLGGLLTAGGLMVGIPLFFGIAIVGAILGLPIYFIDEVVGVHFLSDDPDIMPVSDGVVQWSGPNGKTFTVNLVNRGEPMDRFTLRCDSNDGGFEVVDMSGMLPNQTDTRTYAFPTYRESSVITEVTGCKIVSHMRGKPSDFNVRGEFEREGGGGWGDRIYTGAQASGAYQSGVGALDEIDPTVDYD